MSFTPKSSQRTLASRRLGVSMVMIPAERLFHGGGQMLHGGGKVFVANYDYFSSLDLFFVVNYD